jgi:2-methylcitrate dehydratase PrpD
LKARLPYGGAPQVTIVGRGGRTDLLTGTLINGISGHVLDFDDSQLRATNINPSSTVAPVAISLGEHLHASGLQLLESLILGLEVECRIANAVYAHGSRRWFANTVAGVFGAAACAGKLLGLDAAKMASALGIAASQASGLRIVFGTMCKALIVGRAAQNGLEAALLAREGFSSPQSSIEAPLGYAEVFSPGSDPSPIIENLGKVYEIGYISYKPFACGVVLHAPIDACIRARAGDDFDASRISSVRLDVNPAVVEVTGKTEPHSGLESKFSIAHAAAVALLDGTAGEKQFSDERAAAADVLALRARVRAIPDLQLQRDQARVRIELVDGTVIEHRVHHAIGSLQNPLSRTDLETKFAALADGVLERQAIAELISMCWALPQLADVGAIARKTAPDCR